MEFTGVQLEKGIVATPFEFRPFAVELQLCQRYCVGYGTNGYIGIVYGNVNSGSAVKSVLMINLPQPMRVPATFMALTGTATINYDMTSTVGGVMSGFTFGSNTLSMLFICSTTSLTQGLCYAGYLTGTTGTSVFWVSAEL